MALEAYEIIFPYNKDHSEICPLCVSVEETDDPDDDPVMVRRSPDLYQCEECGLLILAGWDKYRMSKRIILGKAYDDVDVVTVDKKIKDKPKK